MTQTGAQNDSCYGAQNNNGTQNDSYNGAQNDYEQTLHLNFPGIPLLPEMRATTLLGVSLLLWAHLAASQPMWGIGDDLDPAYLGANLAVGESLAGEISIGNAGIRRVLEGARSYVCWWEPPLPLLNTVWSRPYKEEPASLVLLRIRPDPTYKPRWSNSTEASSLPSVGPRQGPS